MQSHLPSAVVAALPSHSAAALCVDVSCDGVALCEMSGVRRASSQYGQQVVASEVGVARDAFDVQQLVARIGGRETVQTVEAVEGGQKPQEHDDEEDEKGDIVHSRRERSHS